MNIQSYLKEVLSHIRSKEARVFVETELENHLRFVKEDYSNKGKTEVEAEEAAIHQMGDSELLGKSMNKLHKPKVDWLMFGGFFVLISLSLLPMIYLQNSYQMDLVARKLIFSIIGIVLLVGCMFFDYRRLLKYGYWFYGVGIAFLILLNWSPLIIVGKPYIKIASLTMEASSSLPLFLVAWACFLSRGPSRLKITIERELGRRSILNWSQDWLKLGLLFILSLLFLVPVANLFHVLLYTILIMVMVLFSSISKKDKIIFTGLVSLVAAVGFIFAALNHSYVLTRIQAFLNPKEFESTVGYTIVKAKEYLANAHLFGQSIPMEGFGVPEAHTDFIFVTLTYGYGWLLAGILTLLLITLSIRMVAHLKLIQDPFGKLLTIGAITLYTISFSWSILMAFGIFPHVSVSLPFFSYGFMPTVLHSFLIGMVLSVYRRKDFLSLSVK